MNILQNKNNLDLCVSLCFLYTKTKMTYAFYCNNNCFVCKLDDF